jgi:DNA gyrase/topoisomerase IV subunit A
MNYHKLILILSFIAAILSACNGNKLKNDEKALTDQILTEEEQLAQEAVLRAKREKELADSIAKLPKGFQFKEERGIDAENPPIVLDIIGTRAQNLQPLKLSDWIERIEYIKLDQVPDSNEFFLVANYIVAP